jgi:hypothetical protein
MEHIGIIALVSLIGVGLAKWSNPGDAFHALPIGPIVRKHFFNDMNSISIGHLGFLLGLGTVVESTQAQKLI